MFQCFALASNLVTNKLEHLSWPSYLSHTKNCENLMWNMSGSYLTIGKAKSRIKNILFH